MRKSFAAALVGVAAVTFAAGVGVTAAPPAKPADPHADHADAGMTQHMACAKACGECALTCDACTAHCGRMLAEGHKDHLQTLRLTQDCAAVCNAAACVSAKVGPLSDVICGACAEACKRCGDACDAAHKGDSVMAKCAASCRACEKACRDMLAARGGK